MTTTTHAPESHFDDPAYWDGSANKPGEGYTGGYRDFPVNDLKAARVLALTKPGDRVLEVGCAFGFVVRRLRDAGRDAHGLDISGYALRRASPGLRPYLVQGQAHDLPFHKPFDFLCSFGMLEHVPPDLVARTMHEFKRVAPRGLLSVTMATDPDATADSSHANLRTYADWKRLAPEGYEVWSDAQEGWARQAARRWAVVSTGIYPVPALNAAGYGYGGIERLVALFLRGLMAVSGPSDGRHVACVCPEGSVLPRGVERFVTGRPAMDFGESGSGPTIAPLAPVTSCFLDFSHSKPVGRALVRCSMSGVTQPIPYLPHLSPIWHDPKIMQPPEPGYNVVALSEWQAERFRRVYQQDCIVLDPHCADADYFRPGGAPREDYLVFIGRLDPTKGALEAIEACRALRQKLVLVGPITPGDAPAYAQEVLKACDGVDIQYRGEVSEAEKLTLLQGAKALFYPVSYPAGQGESHSHKSTEPMLCGTPVIIYDQGAMREVVDEGVTGFVIPGRAGLEQAILACETLDRAACRNRAVQRWDYRGVVAKWLPVMEEVARGARW